MAILDDVRGVVRVGSKLTDGELQTYIDAALADMAERGIAPEYLAPDADGEYQPKVRTAIFCYCKALYGFDNSDSNRLMKSYESIVTGLVNGKHNLRYAPMDISKADHERRVDGSIGYVSYHGLPLHEGRDYEVAEDGSIAGIGAFRGTLR